MTTGILAAALMGLVLGQNPGDTLYFNYRNHAIPVAVPAALQADLRELLLYASSDQGRTWNHVAGPIAPDKRNFAFYAPGDGTYWLRVVQVHRNGVQDPDDRSIKDGPPDMKMVIDTVKPIVKSFQAQRHEDDIYVNWDLQEDNLDPNGMRLEYQVKNSLPESWKAIPIQAALKGQARFSPGHKQALSLRLTVRDLAKNESWSPAEVAGTVTAAGFSTAQDTTTPPPMFPPDNGLPKPSDGPKPLIVPPPVGIDNTMPKGPLGGGSGYVAPPPMGLDSPPRLQGGTPGGLILPPPATMKETVTEKVVADSSLPPRKVEPVKIVPREVAPLGGIQPPPGGMQRPPEIPLDTKPIAAQVPVRKLPPVQYVNQYQIMLEYELKRVGPSGIGGIEVWLTKDDGQTWEPFAKDEDVQSGTVQRRQQLEFDLRDARDRPFADGIYGLSLVVKSRAGLGHNPRPGDVPEIRIEIDTKLPDTTLYMPVPDPQNPEHILLKWKASDKNLADRPIHLEYAAKLDGEWLPIQLNLENTGRFTNEKVTGDYSWKVPANTPLQVYLRLRVRDKAGNERVLVTDQPQYVDLTEPEGILIGVQAPGRRRDPWPLAA